MLFKLNTLTSFSVKGNNPIWTTDTKTYLGQDAYTRVDELLAPGYLVEMTIIQKDRKMSKPYSSLDRRIIDAYQKLTSTVSHIRYVS